MFAAAVSLLYGYGLVLGEPMHWSLLAGYLTGAGFWYAAGLLSAHVVATEYGVIRNINRPCESVGWSQIIDYFAARDDAQTRYVFLYTREDGRRERLELGVPTRCCPAFHRLVREKLDARFEYTLKQCYGKKALEE